MRKRVYILSPEIFLTKICIVASGSTEEEEETEEREEMLFERMLSKRECVGDRTKRWRRPEARRDKRVGGTDASCGGQRVSSRNVADEECGRRSR